MKEFFNVYWQRKNKGQPGTHAQPVARVEADSHQQAIRRALAKRPDLARKRLFAVTVSSDRHGVKPA